MKNLNFIHNIVKSMTMNEKRYFKILCGRHVIGSQNKYVLLFNTIEKLDTFDEEVFKKQLSVKNISTKFLASDLKYLKKIVLKSLNEFHSEKTLSIKILGQLLSVEILFYKGLYEECLLLIKKLKNQVQMSDYQYLMLELLNWEKKCMGYSNGLMNALEINKNIDLLLLEINKGKSITDYYYQSYFLKNNIGKLENKVIEDEFAAMFKDPVFQNIPDLQAVQHKIFYLLIYANYYHTQNTYSKEAFYLKEALTIYDNNTTHKFENPLDYISVYSRLIDILKGSEDDNFYQELENLKSFSTMIDLQKEVASERIYILTFQTELEHILITQKNVTNEFLEKLVEKIPTLKYSLEPYYYIKTFYLIASLYCVTGNFSGGLKYLNKLLNEFKFKDRPSIFIKSELLNIVIHYELKNYSLVSHHIAAFKSKYLKGYKLSFIEQKLLKTISKIANNPYSIKEKKEFTNLLEKVNKKIEVKQTIDINYYNYILKKSKP